MNGIIKRMSKTRQRANFVRVHPIPAQWSSRSGAVPRSRHPSWNGRPLHRTSCRIIFVWSECNYRISENADISTVCWQSARGIYSKNSKWREQRRPTGQRAALSCKSLKGTLPIQSHSCLTQLHFHLNSDEIVLQCAGGICILFRAQLLGI